MTAREYRACYVYRQLLGPESRTIHVAQPGTFRLGYTLCGIKVARLMDIFSPVEATCRECKRRWQLAQRPPVDIDSRLNELKSQISTPVTRQSDYATGRSDTPPVGASSSFSDEELAAIAIYTVAAKLSSRDGTAIATGWIMLAEDERRTYRQMAEACINAYEHSKRK